MGREEVLRVFEKLLAEYTTASERTKLTLAKKYGHNTREDYFKFLQESLKLNQENPIESENQDATDMVVAFDSTGSMKAYIHAVREHVKELIPKMFKDVPNLRMKIVVFGDYCDMSSKGVFGNAYQETPLTDDQNLLIGFVNSAKDTSGGDPDEFYELVIKKIVEETPWRNGKKSVLLIADYTPHPLGYTCRNLCVNNQIDWRFEAKKAADRGIQFDTLKIIPAHTWYNELSQITGGACMDFKNSEQVHNVVMGSTYSRSPNKEAFHALFSRTVSSGDEELIGAMKKMSYDSINFAPEEKERLINTERDIRKSKEKETKK